MDSVIGRYATSTTSQTFQSPSAGAWTSTVNLSSSSGEPMSASRGLPTGRTTQTSQLGSRSDPPTHTEQDAVGRSGIVGATAPDTERHVPGAWTAKSANPTTLEHLSTPRPPAKTTIFEASTTTMSKYAPANGSTVDLAGKGVRPQTSIPIPATSTAGAWTTSSRYATNTSASIFDTLNTKHQSSNNSGRESSATMRQATLGANPVPGAWTTKTTTSMTVISTTSDSTPRHTFPSNLSPPSSLLKPPPPSGTGTGSSTPSSAQTSDINLVSVPPPHYISTRVPISGHPSTPAPVRPALRPTPPPLPRSTIVLPQSQPLSTVTPPPAPSPEKDKAQRKGGFFNFLRPKPTVYEIWTPPGHIPKGKQQSREEPPKDPAPSPPKSKPSASAPLPRPKSPKIFSPFKLFSKRHRTVSSASLDVLDGTAANTVMNSPASSMRADTPGVPPSPPLRDAILATQEWRNKEATELFVSGRKRRHRPGVTFDCPEDIAPADIIPSRLRVARMVEDADDC
ncbi:hypothetical protein JB92DRAFT_542897 [Gautieria morchelliformis]|nr:hypothetical protein JB92DRAFT_542897 [Gautieria morchelliformis]